MDVLPLIEDTLTGLDDPEFAAWIRNAAPMLGALADRLRAVVTGPETSPGDGADAVPTSPEPGTLAHDLEAGIPVFVPAWQA